jgi:hypothetical protein
VDADADLVFANRVKHGVVQRELLVERDALVDAEGQWAVLVLLKLLKALVKKLKD